MTYKLSQYPKLSKFDKEVTWLKINKWAVNLFWCSSDLNLNQIKKEPDMKL